MCGLYCDGFTSSVSLQTGAGPHQRRQQVCGPHKKQLDRWFKLSKTFLLNDHLWLICEQLDNNMTESHNHIFKQKNISSVHLLHDSHLSSFLNFLFNILEFWTEKYFIDLLTPDSPVLMLKEEIFPSNRRSSPVEFSSYSVEGFQTHQDVFIQKTWSWSESKQWFLSSRVGCFHLCLMLLFL